MQVRFTGAYRLWYHNSKQRKFELCLPIARVTSLLHSLTHSLSIPAESHLFLHIRGSSRQSSPGHPTAITGVYPVPVLLLPLSVPCSEGRQAAL